MGWDYYPKPDNVRQDLDDNRTWTSERGTYRVLKSAIVRMREYYAAVEFIDKAGSRTVFCSVAMLDFRPRDPEGYTFGKKDMDETMGPNIDNCPAAILDLLTEPENDWARDWRIRCRAKITARQNRPRLVDGARIKLAEAVHFRNGTKRDTFTVEKQFRTVRFRGEDGGYYRFPRHYLDGATRVD